LEDTKIQHCGWPVSINIKVQGTRKVSKFTKINTDDRKTQYRSLRTLVKRNISIIWRQKTKSVKSFGSFYTVRHKMFLRTEDSSKQKHNAKDYNEKVILENKRTFTIHKT